MRQVPRSRKEVRIRLEEARFVLGSEVRKDSWRGMAVRPKVERLGRVWTPLAR